MVKFRIDLMEADRTGVVPMLYEGRLFGMAADPVTAASRWLMQNKGAKPGERIELYQNGVQRSYTLIKAEDTGDPDDPENEGDIDSPKAPKKKGKKKAADDDEEAEKGDDIEKRDATPDRHEPRGADQCRRAVAATAAAILLAGQRAAGSRGARPV